LTSRKLQTRNRAFVRKATFTAERQDFAAAGAIELSTACISRFFPRLIYLRSQFPFEPSRKPHHVVQTDNTRRNCAAARSRLRRGSPGPHTLHFWRCRPQVRQACTCRVLCPVVRPLQEPRTRLRRARDRFPARFGQGHSRKCRCRRAQVAGQGLRRLRLSHHQVVRRKEQQARRLQRRT
jgi:hypothetical protein